MNFDQAVDRALLNPKYHSIYDDIDRVVKSALEGIKDLILDLLSKININFPDIELAPFSYSSNALFVLSLTIVAIILVIAAIFIIRAVRKRRRRKNGFGMEELFNMLDDKSISTLDLLDLSDKAAGSGDFRNAVRYRYICLLWVTNQNLMSISPSKVNNSILRDINRSFPHLFERFRDVIAVFSFTWFGNKPLEKTAYDGFLLTFQSLLKEASSYEKAQG